VLRVLAFMVQDESFDHEVGEDCAAFVADGPDALALAVRARAAVLGQRRRARGASKPRARARSTASVRLWLSSLA
jgi:hypothetical protein